MRGKIVLALLPLAAVGCGSARFVQKDATGGVIALPSNTALNHKKAEELIVAHVGPGYQIVEEKEVVTGQSTTNLADTKTEPALHSKVPFLPAERQTTTTTTTTRDVTEWQIVYRKLSPSQSDPLLQQAGGITPARSAAPAPK